MFSNNNNHPQGGSSSNNNNNNKKRSNIDILNISTESSDNYDEENQEKLLAKTRDIITACETEILSKEQIKKQIESYKTSSENETQKLKDTISDLEEEKNNTEVIVTDNPVDQLLKERKLLKYEMKIKKYKNELQENELARHLQIEEWDKELNTINKRINELELHIKNAHKSIDRMRGKKSRPLDKSSVSAQKNQISAEETDYNPDVDTAVTKESSQATDKLSLENLKKCINTYAVQHTLAETVYYFYLLRPYCPEAMQMTTLQELANFLKPHINTTATNITNKFKEPRWTYLFSIKDPTKNNQAIDYYQLNSIEPNNSGGIKKEKVREAFNSDLLKLIKGNLAQQYPWLSNSISSINTIGERGESDNESEIEMQTPAHTEEIIPPATAASSIASTSNDNQNGMADSPLSFETIKNSMDQSWVLAEKMLFFYLLQPYCDDENIKNNKKSVSDYATQLNLNKQSTLNALRANPLFTKGSEKSAIYTVAKNISDLNLLNQEGSVKNVLGRLDNPDLKQYKEDILKKYMWLTEIENKSAKHPNSVQPSISETGLGIFSQTSADLNNNNSKLNNNNSNVKKKVIILDSSTESVETKPASLYTSFYYLNNPNDIKLLELEVQESQWKNELQHFRKQLNSNQHKLTLLENKLEPTLDEKNLIEELTKKCQALKELLNKKFKYDHTILPIANKNLSLMVAPVAAINNQLGLFTKKVIHPYENNLLVIIGSYQGEMRKEGDIVLNLEGNYYLWDISEELVCDALFTGNATRFFNSSQLNNVQSYTHPPYGVCFYPVRNIKPNEQLLINYGWRYEEKTDYTPCYLHPSDGWEHPYEIHTRNKTYYQPGDHQLDSKLCEFFNLDPKKWHRLPKITYLVLTEDTPPQELLSPDLFIYTLAQRQPATFNAEQQQVTALMVACYLGKVKWIEKLLAAGALADRCGRFTGDSALTILMQNKDLPVKEIERITVKMLGEITFANVLNNKKLGIAHYAIEKNMPEILEQLLKFSEKYKEVDRLFNNMYDRKTWDFYHYPNGITESILEKHKDSFIYTKENNQEVVYYINKKGEKREVPLKDKSLFKNQFLNLLLSKENKCTLTLEKLQSLITDNGGFTWQNNWAHHANCDDCVLNDRFEILALVLKYMDKYCKHKINDWLKDEVLFTDSMFAKASKQQLEQLQSAMEKYPNILRYKRIAEKLKTRLSEKAHNYRYR